MKYITLFILFTPKNQWKSPLEGWKISFPENFHPGAERKPRQANGGSDFVTCGNLSLPRRPSQTRLADCSPATLNIKPLSLIFLF